ncbi:MAG: hypothetical protein JXR52_09870 [Bacteroidales bacterium]|nr:hypothetical protein [Bacteroidales bacterium]MBN2699123.1 hypothetical protein [Bacteroidales bacterium]
MKIIPVSDRKTEKLFIDLPRRLYRNDPNFVMPFNNDIRKAFNRDKNSYFSHGDARRWIVLDEKGKTVGRIAAFYDNNKDQADYVKSGGCGFFECIDDRQAAFLLFDTARDWLSKNSYEAMTGPINFGESDNNWGCLVHGFVPQGFGMTYNLPYYRQLFETYGFKLYYRQFSFHLDLEKPFPERFWKIAEWINKRPGYSFRHFDYRETEKFVQDMVSVHDQAWKELKADFTPMNPDTVYDVMNRAKPIIDPELIWFAYYNDEPIAFFVFFPDANQIFRHLNGKLHLINKIRFVIMKKNKTITRLRGIVAGVVPKFQNSGVESGIFWQLREVMEHRKHIREFELSWVGDFNPKMISLYMATGAYHAKTHHTYRYLFNPDQKFIRFMPEAVDESKIPGY